ncbi:MAG: DUF4421 family protein [Flavobacteriia bacterium]|nr:DUF4421 family protein [Flavobacteriia bacterium]
MKPLLLCTVFVFSCLSLKAQQDSTYIRDFRDYGNLSLAMESKANNITIFGRRGGALRLTSNNGLPTYGVMFSYKWLNVWATTKLGPLTYSDETKGETNNLGLAVGYTGDHWWARVFFEQYQGYHIANPESFSPNWFDENDNYPLIPDLRSTTVYGNVYYGFNEKTYSHRAMLWQSQEQRKSAGSWLMGVSLGYDHIFSDTSLVPVEGVIDYYEIRNVSGYETVNAALNVGYTYSWAFWDRWSFGLMFAPGIAGTYGIVKEMNGTNRGIDFELAAMAEGRAILSYHHDRWYGGLAANAYMLMKPVKGDFYSNLHTYIRFNVGYRINMPKSKFLGRFGLSSGS